uniref:Putative ovule protein n=1 Tax=Solanum chacoense TaxID=4108 RepID=A0A0V0GRG9_SOLCH
MYKDLVYNTNIVFYFSYSWSLLSTLLIILLHAMFSCQTIEANEATIKFSTKLQIFFHPNEKQTLMEFIAFSNCFYGRTIGVVALTSKEHYRCCLCRTNPR